MMLQAPVLDGELFDPFSLLQDFFSPSKVDISRGQVAEALMISATIVVLNESFDL